MVEPVALVKSLSTATAFPGVQTLERQRGRPYLSRLGSNEGLFGTSPLAMEAGVAAASRLGHYNDPRCYDLIQAISAAGAHEPETILVDAGIDGLLGLLVRGYVEPGATALTTQGSYPTFNYQAVGHGGRLFEVPYDAGYHCDLDALCDAARSQRAKLCYLSNPDNPTGTYHGREALIRFIDAMPRDCLILLDEAYAEFVPAADVLPMDFRRDNLVRLRTFSKAYGLASARVGYMIGDKAIVAALNRIRLHFGVAMLSQVMARAALSDQAFLADVVAATEAGRADIKAIAASCSIACVPSQANFVALDFGSAERAVKAAAVMEEFDVFVRRPPEKGVDRLMRVTVGPKTMRERFANALQAAQRA